MIELEPMADVASAIGDIEAALRRLYPARAAFYRLNEYHGKIKLLEAEVAYWKAKAEGGQSK